VPSQNFIRSSWSLPIQIQVRNYLDGQKSMPPPPRLAILHEEIEHEAWFSEFLGHGPSGHYSREGRPNSPYVGKFLNAGQPDEHPERVGSKPADK
jgi:hypothetical protein